MPFDLTPVDAFDDAPDDIPTAGAHLVRVLSAALLNTRHGTQIKAVFRDDQAAVKWTGWYRAEGDQRWQAQKFCQALDIDLKAARDDGEIDDALQALEGGAVEVLVRLTGRKDDGTPWVNTDPVRYLGPAHGSTRTDIPVAEAELANGRVPLSTPLPIDDDEPIPF